MYIPKSTIKRILKSAGAGRISDDALSAFHTSINKFAYDTASKAVRLAKHAKRKTVDTSDVKLALN